MVIHGFSQTVPSAATHTDVFSVADLLRNGDGRCGAWNGFFITTAATQGIAVHTAGHPLAPETIVYVDITAGHDAEDTSGLGGVQSSGPLVIFDPTIQGQGGIWPSEYGFVNHAVAMWVRADASVAIYDPSYGGSVYATPHEWEERGA